MIATIFAAAAVASGAPSLDLRLICNGEYQDTETATAQTMKRDEDGNWRTATTQMRRNIMREGTARLKFSGQAGELVYPDGRVRELVVITADPSRVVAQYERKILFGRMRWKIEVNRMTGDVRVASKNDVAFLGACSPEPTQPKF